MKKDIYKFNERGNVISRLDTFIDAAFAFATTMLVISVGEILNDFSELIKLLKQFLHLRRVLLQ